MSLALHCRLETQVILFINLFGLSKGLEKRLAGVRYAFVSEYHGSKK